MHLAQRAVGDQAVAVLIDEIEHGIRRVHVAQLHVHRARHAREDAARARNRVATLPVTDAVGEQADARSLRLAIARAVAQVPVARQLVLELAACTASARRPCRDRRRAGTCRSRRSSVTRRVSGPDSVPMVRIDTGHADHVAVGVIGQRQAGVEDDVVVDVLHVEIDRAALEVARRPQTAAARPCSRCSRDRGCRRPRDRSRRSRRASRRSACRTSRRRASGRSRSIPSLTLPSGVVPGGA